MSKYFMVTPKIAARLRGKIFNGISEAIYGAEGGRIDRENSFDTVRGSLSHILHNSHFEKTTDFAEQVLKLKSAYDALSPDSRQALKALMDRVISLSRRQFNDHYKVDDVRKFAELGLAGRQYYESEGYDPEQFITTSMLALAELIVGNFAAYEKTLNHKYV